MPLLRFPMVSFLHIHLHKFETWPNIKRNEEKYVLFFDKITRSIWTKDLSKEYKLSEREQIEKGKVG